MKYCCCRLHLT